MSLEYIKKGEAGSKIILLHGFGGGPQDWDEVATHLTYNSQVYIPKLRQSQFGTPGPMTFRQQLSQIEQFVESLRQSPHDLIFVVGASYGGALAWALSLMRPDLLHGLILVSPMPPRPMMRLASPIMKVFLWLSKWPSVFIFIFSSPLGSIALPEFERVFHVPWVAAVKKRFRFGWLTRRKVQVIWMALARFRQIVSQEDWMFWESRLRFLAVPVLMIWGEKDKVFSFNEMLRFQKKFLNSQGLILKDAGHLVHVERPREIAYLILKKIQTLASGQDFSRLQSDDISRISSEG